LPELMPLIAITLGSFLLSKEHMKTVTTHQAKTHLSRLLREVESGETIIILSGQTKVAKLTPIGEGTDRRPAVGTLSSKPVHLSEDACQPLTDEELAEWGL